MTMVLKLEPIKGSLQKIYTDKDFDGDGKKDYAIRVFDGPSWDNCRHYTTYVDTNNDGNFDYKIKETQPNGNFAKPTYDKVQPGKGEERNMLKILADLDIGNI